ncbi:hypothetical protein [Nocardioides currus]|uniref:Uncharacterized protein n=1 Tax=Nocardioides currus TaxID=2133958 RepID=A0A2R7YS49_9ACTN|nr:hypothetical protein [Nocardioides currus]PUA79238.1 hypothetical protein C7S10_19585 [Nocardioides currus]
MNTPRTVRSTLLALLALALAASAAVAASVSTTAVADAPRGPSLTIKVAGPVARIVVTGPKGFKKTIVRTTTLRGLRPGAYQVRASKIKVGRSSQAAPGTYYPSITTRKITLGKRTRTTTKVRYSLTRLRLAVGNRPRGTTAPAVLVQPNGKQRKLKLTKAVTLSNVPAGRYTLKLATIRSKDKRRPGTYTAPYPTTITVGKGQLGKLTTDYDVVTSPDLVVASATDVVSVATSTEPAGPGVVRMVTGYSPGDIVSIPPGAATPTGALVKVVSVGATQAGGAVDYQVVNADITEAVTEADFAASVPTSFDLSSANPETSARRRGKTPFAKSLTCGGSANLEVDAAVSGSVDTTFDLSWKSTYVKRGPFWVWSGATPQVKMDATAKVEAYARATISGKASCELAETNLLVTPLRTAPIPIPGVPGLFLTPESQFTISGSVSSEATVATGVEASVSSSIGATVTPDKATPYFLPPKPVLSAQAPSISAKANASVYLGNKTTFLVNGVAGPYVKMRIGPEFAADPALRPWWKLDLGFKAGVGFRAQVLGFKIDKFFDDFAHATFPVSQAAGGIGDDGTVDTGLPPTGPALRSIATYGVRNDLQCSLYTDQDELGEFFGDNGPFTTEGSASDDNGDACGTFAVIDGVLYGPRKIPAFYYSDSTEERPVVPWQPVSQTLSGSNTAASPSVLRTVVTAPGTGVQLVQTDKWWAGGSAISTSIKVVNAGAPRAVRVSRGIDCYLGDLDTGYGEMRPSAELVGCLRTIVPDSGPEVEASMRLQSLTPGSTWMEGYYSDVWDAMTAMAPLPNTCRCSEDIDNGVALSWAPTLAQGGDTLLRSELSLTRAGS